MNPADISLPTDISVRTPYLNLQAVFQEHSQFGVKRALYLDRLVGIVGLEIDLCKHQRADQPEQLSVEHCG